MSICLDPGRPWADLQKLVQRVDATGWYAVYLPDHFMPHDPADRVLDGPVLECWTTLSALAAQTATIRVGTLVLSNTYRHPAVVANMAATLDQVTGGRVVLGIGAGWQPNEHRAYGLPSTPRRTASTHWMKHAPLSGRC
jgi:alkanesulfonate monooxygenase SsuD/methylene tetrahydromethanopterin reductase-like flavin-dependent oxidoreductase (luciferase family)